MDELSKAEEMNFKAQSSVRMPTVLARIYLMLDLGDDGLSLQIHVATPRNTGHDIRVRLT